MPFNKGSISYTKEQIYDFLSTLGCDTVYINIIYEIIINQNLEEEDFFYLENSLIYLMSHKQISKDCMIILDDIQQLNKQIYNMLIHLFSEINQVNCNILFVLSFNDEDTTIYATSSNDVIDTFYQFKKDYSDMFHIKKISPFTMSDAKIFLTNIFKIYDDTFFELFLKKSGYRVFDIISMYKYMEEKNVVKSINHELLLLDGTNNLQSLFSDIPADSHKVIKKRFEYIRNILDSNLYKECLLIINYLLCFYNKMPEVILYDNLINIKAYQYLLQIQFIKLEESFICFYHDSLYQFFIHEKMVFNKKTLYTNIKNWIVQTDIDFDSKELIVFYDIFYNKTIDLAIQQGIQLISSLIKQYNYNDALIICEELLNIENLDDLSYFKISVLFASCLWETIDAKKAIDIYESIKEKSKYASKEEQCEYYHKYINALFHYGFHIDALELLSEFEKINPKSDYYTFILYNRYSVAYFRLKDFDSANYYIDKSIDIAEKLDGTFWLSTAYSEKAFNYMFNRLDRQKTIVYLKLAIENYKDNEDHTYYRKMEILYQNALLHLIENQYQKAMHSIDNGISLCKKLNNVYMEIKLSNIKAITLVLLDEYKKAVELWKDILHLSISIKSKNWQLHILYNLAETYFNISKINSAKEYYEEVLLMIERSENTYNNIDLYQGVMINLALIYHSLKDNDSLNDLEKKIQDHIFKIKINNIKNGSTIVMKSRTILKTGKANYYY